MTNEQKPADQGRGVGEVSVSMVLASMRNWAGVADRCAVTEGHAPSCIRIWADQLEAAIAALTQPKGSFSAADVQRAWDAYNAATDRLDASEEGSLMDRMHAGMKAALGTVSLPRQSEAAPVGYREHWEKFPELDKPEELASLVRRLRYCVREAEILRINQQSRIDAIKGLAAEFDKRASHHADDPGRESAYMAAADEIRQTLAMADTVDLVSGKVNP